MQFDLVEITTKVLELLVFPAISALAIYFTTWLKAKKLELEEKIKNDTTKKYIDMLDKTVIECVLATKQTYVDALKKEGTFDIEAQKKAFQLTFDAITSTLTDEAQVYLNTAVKDLKAYITTKIEASISATK